MTEMGNIMRVKMVVKNRIKVSKAIPVTGREGP
jgi:hypothetical protein